MLVNFTISIRFSSILRMRNIFEDYGEGCSTFCLTIIQALITTILSRELTEQVRQCG